MASSQLEIGRVRLAALAGKVITDEMALVERREPRTLDGAGTNMAFIPIKFWAAGGGVWSSTPAPHAWLGTNAAAAMFHPLLLH